MRDKALIVVDLQKDFLPGGALAVQQGTRIIGVINSLIKSFTWNQLIMASRCWHPENMLGHFKKYGKHCVQNTEGAKFHEDLNLKNAMIVSKGTEINGDGLSIFDGYVEDDKTSTSVVFFEQNIKTIFFAVLSQIFA